jgi:succinate semialdehyde dehydrogenase (EC 1.2.1.16)
MELSMTLRLQDPALMRHQCYIDGSWVNAERGATLEVTNPATGESLGQIARAGAVETRQAIVAAQTAQIAWRQLTAGARAKLLRLGTS